MKLLTAERRDALEHRAFDRHRDSHFTEIAIAVAVTVLFTHVAGRLFGAIAACWVVAAVAAYLRREMALGALMADERKRAILARWTPQSDMRVVPTSDR